MKTKRNLSGVYFRSRNKETNKYEPIAFEDLASDEQDGIMDGRSEEWLKSLAKQLANTLNSIGEQFDIEKE